MPRQKRITGPIGRLQEREPIVDHIFVDTESNWSQVDGKTSITRHTLRFGYAKHCRWNGKELEIVRDVVFHNRKRFWNWVRDGKYLKQCWVWAHNLSFDGTMLGLWDRLQAGYSKLGHFTDCDLPAFFYVNMWGKPLLFLDSLNIFKDSLANIGKELDKPKMQMPEQKEGLDKWIPYCQNDVNILHLIVERWIDFLVRNKLGRMSPSLAGQALTAFRTRFMQHEINIHCNDSVCELERDGYFGGLVEPRFIGKVPAKQIFEFDVNSLYPYVMTNRKYPNLLMGSERWPRVDSLLKICKKQYIIAHVEIETDNNVYPMRHKGRLTFATGRYWTVLHKPELQRALLAGDIRNCDYVARYSEADIFSDYVAFFYNLRLQYTSLEHKTFHYICKLFLNSLYGKFGQKRPKWESYTEKTLRHIEYLTGLNDGELDVLKEHLEHHDKYTLKFRHPSNNVIYAARRILGEQQIMMGEGESPLSFPAIAGAVTSYARDYVRSIQDMIPDGSLFYTDTDSFFVDGEGKAKLIYNEIVDDKKLGYLKAKTVNDWMIIHGPKDYQTNNELKRKGIRPKAILQLDGSWKQERWPGFKGLLREGLPTHFDVRETKKRLHRKLLACRVDRLGWTHPLVITALKRKRY